MYLKKLKIILQSNEIYYLLLLITILITSLKIFLVVTFPYEKENTTKIGIVQNIQIDGNQLTLQLKNKIQGKYTIQSKKEKQWISKSINIGDKIKLEGILSQTNQLNEFIMIKKYQKLKSRTNLWIKIKRFIIKKASKNAYLKAFILGDKGDLSQEEITSYQENGISHLLALSGMHVTIISTILFKILQILFPKKKIAYQLTNIFLLLYLNIVELSPSILRATIFYILSIQNKLYQLSIKPINLWIMVLSIVLLINPFYLINVGFQYSFFISFILIFMREWINNSKTKINQFLKISYLSYIASIPISLFHFYQINVLSILYNLIFIPYITIIVFPLSLLTLGINQILPVYNIVTTILREASLLLNKMKYLTIICKKLSFVIYIIYVISIFYYLYYLKQGKKKYPISLIILLLIHTIYPKIYSKSYIEMIDQTTPNMIQRISGIFERKPLISREI